MSNRLAGNEFSCINYPLCFFLVTSFYSTLNLIIKLQIVSSREMNRTRSAARTNTVSESARWNAARCCWKLNRTTCLNLRVSLPFFLPVREFEELH